MASTGSEEVFQLVREQLSLLHSELQVFRNELAAVRQKAQEIEVQLAVLSASTKQEKGISPSVFKWTVGVVVGIVGALIALMEGIFK